MQELTKRVITGVCLGPFIAILFYYLPVYLFFVLILIVSALAAHEWITMAGVQDRYVVLLLSVPCIFPLYGNFLNGYLLWIIFSPAVYLLFRIINPRNPTTSLNREIGKTVTVLVLTQVFIILPLSYLYRLKAVDPFIPVILLFIIWASDTAAYLLGRSFGKRPLAPLISPKKTYEGLLGAVLGSLLLTLLFRGRLGMAVSESCFVGSLLGLLGQAGDVFESIGKRVCEKKDSSGLIPGHGGILDRVDSFLFTAPFLYHYLVGLKG